MSRESLIYRGWTLLLNSATGLWTAHKEGLTLPPRARTVELRALIDAITPPEVAECCTGEAPC